MFLKIITIDGFKKIKFKKEYENFETFKKFISELIKEKYEDLKIVAFDNSKNKIIIKKKVDFTYFLEDCKNIKFKEIFIEKEKKDKDKEFLELQNFIKVPSLQKIDSEDFYLIKETTKSIDEEEFIDISKKEIKEDNFIRISPEKKKVKKIYKIFEETFEIKTLNKLIICKICKEKSFIGKRFKCLICENFNTCENCEKKNQHLHPMIRLTENYDENFLQELNKNFVSLVKKFKNDKLIKKKFEEKKKMINFIFGKFKNESDKITRDKFVRENIDLEINEFNKILMKEKNKINK